MPGPGEPRVPRADRPGTRAAEPRVPRLGTRATRSSRTSTSSSAATSPSRRWTSKTWKLKVEGAVEKPLELTYDELTKLPVATLTATHRVRRQRPRHLTPPVPGLQWGQGAVGNAEWDGVPLAAILEKAGVKNSAVEVVLEGADKGQINADPKSPGPIHFARSLPIDKAKKDEVLLAYKMNGETLPPSHGYPLRAVVGGWYGMASVKWLTRIIVTESRSRASGSRSTTRTSSAGRAADAASR